MLSLGFAVLIASSIVVMFGGVVQLVAAVADTMAAPVVEDLEVELDDLTCRDLAIGALGGGQFECPHGCHTGHLGEAGGRPFLLCSCHQHDAGAPARPAPVTTDLSRSTLRGGPGVSP
jgi:hypothetical protein